MNGVPVTYSVDGATSCVEDPPGYFNCIGPVNLNAFLAQNTTTGGSPGDPENSVDVPVSAVFVDPNNGDEINVDLTITYDEVVTDGYTTVVTSSQAAGDIDPNFYVDVPGFATVFFDISTTAQVNGPIVVCGDYNDADQDGILDGTLANECDLRALHNGEGPPDEFVDSTLAASDPLCPFNDVPQQTTCGDLCIDTVTNKLCAGVANLSPFIFRVRNQVPVAAAGDDIGIESRTVQLDGTQSYDPEGYSIGYAWSFASKPTGSVAQLMDANTATPSFFADLDGDYVVELVVTDALGRSSAPDSVLASFANVPPVADPGPPQSVRAGDSVLLDGTNSDDVNGDALTYQWSILSAPLGSAAALDDPMSATPTFAPDLAGTYEVELIVNDGFLDSQVASVTVVATTAQGELVDTLEYAIDLVNAFDPGVFKNQSLQKNMAKHIAQALNLVDAGDYRGAHDKLEAVLRKTDGCASNGGRYRNDWIVDCTAQADIQPVLEHAISLVNEILGA